MAHQRWLCAVRYALRRAALAPLRSSRPDLLKAPVRVCTPGWRHPESSAVRMVPSAVCPSGRCHGPHRAAHERAGTSSTTGRRPLILVLSVDYLGTRNALSRPE